MKSLLLNLLFAGLVFGQEPSLVNSNGDQIDTPEEQSAFITALGGTDAGKALFQLPNPSAVTFPRINADNTASLLSAEQMLTELGATSSMIDATSPPYNAVGDAEFNDGATMTSGAATLTCAAGTFSAEDVGKFIRVVGAGTAGADLVTTIAARASNTSITLTANATTTVSSAQLFYGTDNTTAIQAAITAANASSSTKKVFIPGGKYLCNVTSFPNVDIVGAGAPNQQIVFNKTNIDANTKSTFLFPALATSPIIYLATIYGASVQDIAFVGGDGTTLSDRKGTGIQLGVVTAGATGATGGSFACRRCEFSGLERGIHAASMWDSVFEMLAFNYCDRGFLGGEVPLGFAGAGGPADGLTFLSCQSNYTDIVFEFDRCKQSTIIAGDFNSMVSFVKSYNSAVIVSGVNLESASNCAFHLAGADTSRLDAAYLETQAVTDLVWNEDTSGNAVSIRGGPGLNYKTASSTGYPLALPRGSTILRYTDATFATLKRTEKWDWIARNNWERENNFRLYDPFIKSAASPYGSLGWTGTAISTFTTGQFGNQSNAFYIYLSANTKAVRFAPEYANAEFFTNWRMSWIFKNVLNVSTMALRMGLYTYDATALMIPANGIGMRADTVTAGDTTVKLEVIVNSVIQTTVDTGIAITALDDVFYEMVLEKQGSVIYLMLINKLSGAVVANQVSYSGTLPTNSPTYCAPMIFLGTSSASGTQLNFRQMNFEEIK